VLATQPILLSNGKKSFRAEGSLCINVKSFPFTTIVVDGELTGDTQSVAKLCFSCPELTKDFSDGTGFNTTFI
jgi:hypothetical protein